MDDFAEFFGARRDVVFRAVLLALGDRVGAEDAVSEAFARACHRWSSVREHPNPTAWVIRTALNVSRSWWRHRRREVLCAAAVSVGAQVAAPAEPFDAALHAALAALPRRQREVIALRVLVDLSAAETGLLLGIATATVHVHLHRALDALRATVVPDREIGRPC